MLNIYGSFTENAEPFCMVVKRDCIVGWQEYKMGVIVFLKDFPYNKLFINDISMDVFKEHYLND